MIHPDTSVHEPDMATRRNSITILLNMKSRICTEALRRLLHGEKSSSNKSFFVYCRGTIGNRVPDIILSDPVSIQKKSFDLFPDAKLAVLDFYGLTRDEVLLIFESYRNMHGVILKDTDFELFKKALAEIHRGEIWLDVTMVRQLLRKSNHMNSQRGELSCLTNKELMVTNALCVGYSNEEIANSLNLSLSTVKSHLTRIYKKLGVRNRANLLILLVMQQDEQKVQKN